MATLSQFQTDRNYLLGGTPRENEENIRLSPEGAPPRYLPGTRQGTLEQRLYEPIRVGAKQGEESLSKATGFFREEAGPERSFETAGGTEALRAAVEEGKLDPARQLVGAKYEGPTGLGERTVAGLQDLTRQLRTRQQALRTGGGLQTLIGQSVAGLTPGQARYEARRQLPESRQRAQQLGFEAISPLETRLAQERREAQEFAGRRAEQEADIAQRAREELTGRRAGISGALEQLVARRGAEQSETEQAWRDIVGATPEGRMEALRASAPGVAQAFETPARQASAAAEAEFQRIMSDPRFADIAQYDPLQAGISGRGKPWWELEGQDVRQVVGDPATRIRLYERQRALEEAFGRRGAQGSPFQPLYHGEGFQAPDPVQYLGFDPGVRPSRENVSTEEQRTQYNRIQDLLGKAERMGETEPFRAAQIMAEADRYLQDEEEALRAKKGELSEQGRQWRNSVRKARKQYKKSKYAKIGEIVGSVGLSELSPAFSKLPFAVIGKSIGGATA